MKTITCDKCGKNINFSQRTIKCFKGYLFLRGELPHQVAIDEIELCVECKDKLEKIIKEYPHPIILKGLIK